MEQSKEMILAIEQAQNGYWFPLVTVICAFSIVISLLLYIWNLSQKSNSKRHEDNEKIISDLSKSAIGQAALNERLTTLVERNVEDIKHIKGRK